MSLNVDYKNVSGQEDAYHLACEQITPEYVAKFKVKTEIEYDEGNYVISATGKGFTLTLNFHSDHCEVGLKLSFMYKALKGKVLSKVEEKLQRHL